MLEKLLARRIGVECMIFAEGVTFTKGSALSRKISRLLTDFFCKLIVKTNHHFGALVSVLILFLLLIGKNKQYFVK